MRISQNDMSFANVIIFTFDKDKKFSERLDAEHAVLEAGNLHLYNVTRSIPGKPPQPIAEVSASPPRPAAAPDTQPTGKRRSRSSPFSLGTKAINSGPVGGKLGIAAFRKISESENWGIHFGETKLVISSRW